MHEAVIQALEEQVGCYRRLAKLAELQHAHVQRDETELLLQVLQSRQLVLDEITQLEQVIAPAKRRWREFVQEITSEDRTQAESLVGEARVLLQQISQSDQNDALVLQQRKLNIGRQLNQASAARQVNRQYAAAAYGQRASKMDVQR